MVEYSLSFSDLMMIDRFKVAIKEEDIQAVHRVLFENGLDVSQGATVVSCIHRNLQGKEFTGPRYEGYERLDSVWVKSGAASMEAIIESTCDKSLRKELRTMSRQVQQDTAWQHIKSGALDEKLPK
jgi:hypothetical protein